MAFGDPTIFMEQQMPHVRHVEVQIIADLYGTTWAAGVRDCTVQRRHQKISKKHLRRAFSRTRSGAARSGRTLESSSGYHNAGTVEFLYEPEINRFSFMEMNTRLQVEHPVTECTTGLDLVKLQITWHAVATWKVNLLRPPVMRSRSAECGRPGQRFCSGSGHY